MTPRPGHAIKPEHAVREALRELLRTQETGAKTVDEFWLPRSNERVDIAVIGRTMTAFEIKSDHDTLRRLPRQADAYARVFDRCIAVVAERHRERSLDLLPNWWGITSVAVNGHVTFDEVRRPRPNPAVDPEVLVRLLWREEVSAALVSLGQPPAKTASRSLMWRDLLDAVDVKKLRTIVRRALLTRDEATARIPNRRVKQHSEVAGADR